jgi:TolB-like protein
MADFFAELKRRHIYRVGAAYVVVAWALTQGVAILAQIFVLPSWIAQTTIVLLAIGFPAALIAAWMIESKPHEAVASAVRSKPTIVDWTLCGALAVVLVFMAYQQIAPSQQPGVDAARSASLDPARTISLAVLPFGNLSSDPEQEFFSDGITEEITAALAKVPDLRVVGRTSAFEFKGQNRDLRAIGQALSATHLIEGSVRKAGDRVRITAQLINADDGTHLWSENYDRELTDIFAIQEDIARAIATSLRMPLGLKPGQNLVSTRNIDPEIYQEFLRIRARASTALGNASRAEATEALEKLLARAPNFAQAWASLSGTYFQSEVNRVYGVLWNQPIEESRRQLPLIYEKSERAAREAIRLDESQVIAYRTLASIEYHRNNWAAAEDLFRKGSEVDPHDPDLLIGHALFLTRTGRVKQALQVMQEVHALEPLTPAANVGLALTHFANNQPDAAIALLEGRAGIGVLGQTGLAQAYAMTGQFDKAGNVVLEIGRGAVGQRLGPSRIGELADLLRNARKVRDPKALPSLPESLDFIYAYVGAEDRLLDFSERALEADLFSELRFLFNPVYSPARKTERFETLVRKAGLVDYWKARGWADMCRPTDADDFECS